MLSGPSSLNRYFCKSIGDDDVNEEFIQTKRGAWNETHELIPMTKVQSVKLNQGPFLRKYNLYSLSIGTMGDSHDILANIPEKESV